MHAAGSEDMSEQINESGRGLAKRRTRPTAKYSPKAVHSHVIREVTVERLQEQYRYGLKEAAARIGV